MFHEFSLSKENQLKFLINWAPVVLFAFDHNGVITLSEGKELKKMGLKPGEDVGRNVFDLYHDSPQNLRNIERALAGEENISSLGVYGGCVWETHLTGVRDETGKVIGAVGLITDITQRDRLEKSQAFLVQAGKVLFESLDYKATLERVANMCVPFLADIVVIDLLDDQGELEEFGLALAEPEKADLLFEMRHKCLGGNRGKLRKQVAVTGQPMLLPDLGGEVLRKWDMSEEGIALAEKLEFGSGLFVPLSVRETRLGVISLMRTRRSRIYDEQDKTVAEELALRAAMAIENARLYKENRK